MALPEVQQALTLINRSQSIMLLVPAKPSLDAFASMTALYVALVDHQQKQLDAISPSHVPKALQFLPGSSQATMHPRTQPDVVLDIAGPEEIVDIRTEKLNGGLRLHVILPEQTTIHKDQLETLVRALPYDLAIILGAADLEEIGDLFTNNTDFFYNTPIINIDYRAKNEHFGTVNMVDITASSVAEVVYELISNIPDKTITPDIATALYAGMVSATESFQKPTVNPRAFAAAAKLMEADADKEAVIQHVVKTKPLPLLKLLGRTYARLRYDEHGQVYWSILQPIDFQESNASYDDIPDTMHELESSIAGFAVAFLMYEHEGQYHIYLVLGKGLSSRRQEISEKLGAHKENGALRLSLSAPTVEAAEETALTKIRSVLS